jgi:DNA-binding winged helix-turn-helix (wHTH) protein
MRATFGEFVFDSETRELTCSGEARHLSGKAFDLLELLIANAPRALTKEVLYRHIWGERFVDEVNLPNLMCEVRAALGDSRRQKRFIKTLHGYGYAFAGPLNAGREEPSGWSGDIFALHWRRREFVLRPGENLVGRGEDADVMIDSAAVSRRHARVVVSPDGATIEDLGSKNGTFVGDTPVTGCVSLSDGDEVRIGHLSLTFRTLSRAGSTVTHMTNGGM